MWNTLKAVLWAFLGIRSNHGYEQDRKKLKVHHVIVAGLFCALVFVMGLLFLVRMLTTK